MAKKATRRWSRRVTRESDALDLKQGVFTLKDPKRIAASLKRSAERSTRKKADPVRSALSMLTFYINRAGKNLPATRRNRLMRAKDELRNLGRSSIYSIRINDRFGWLNLQTVYDDRVRALRRTDPSSPARMRETADGLRQELLRQPEDDVGKQHDERDGDQKHEIERKRAEHRAIERHADEFRCHQQAEPVGRRDQAEHQRGDDHHAHVHRLDIADLGQLVDDRHEDDDRWHRVDEIADHDEEEHQQEHE